MQRLWDISPPINATSPVFPGDTQYNRVDHIVMGACGHSPLRRYLGSVSSTVVAESLCTVTVVRASAPNETEGGDTARRPALDSPGDVVPS